MASVPTWVSRLLKLALFVLIFSLLVTLVMLIGSAATGPWEKVALGVTAVGVYLLAVPVHRIGTEHTGP